MASLEASWEPMTIVWQNLEDQSKVQEGEKASLLK